MAAVRRQQSAPLVPMDESAARAHYAASWLPHASSSSTQHAAQLDAAGGSPMTSGIQLQEAPPKYRESEPEIRPKRRLWICRGLCGFDGTRPCWCCSPCCFVITLVVLWLLFLIIMFIGQAVEQAEVAKAPDTDWVYDTLEVCSASNRTYATLDAARSAGQLSRHCGACGQCSNAHDIQIYHDTKATLTETSTACAVRSITEGAAARVHGYGAGRHRGTMAPLRRSPWAQLNVPPLARMLHSFQSRSTLGRAVPPPAPTPLKPCAPPASRRGGRHGVL